MLVNETSTELCADFFFADYGCEALAEKNWQRRLTHFFFQLSHDSPVAWAVNFSLSHPWHAVLAHPAVVRTAAPDGSVCWAGSMALGGYNLHILQSPWITPHRPNGAYTAQVPGKTWMTRKIASTLSWPFCLAHSLCGAIACCVTDEHALACRRGPSCGGKAHLYGAVGLAALGDGSDQTVQKETPTRNVAGHSPTHHHHIYTRASTAPHIMFDKKKSTKELSDNSSDDYEANIQPATGIVEDAVFGELNEDGPNYRGLGKWGSLIIMTKANLGLGVLALPSVFGVLGIVPGVICIVVVQSIIACKCSRPGTSS